METEQGMPEQGMTETETVAAFDKLFAEAETPKPERPRGPDGKFLPVEEAKPEPEAEGEPEAEAEPEAEKEEEEAPPVQTVKVKIDGLEQELPLDEVKNGYLRQSDYTRKTQELAEQRKRFEAEELQAVRQERQVYAERLEMLQEVLESMTGQNEPDWEALSRTLAPEDFTARFTSWKAQTEQIQKAKAEHERVRSLQMQDMERDRAARLQSEQARLAEAIPDLKDPEKGKVLRQDLIDYAKSIGFTDDDLSGVEDHRPLVLLHKARLWDESQKRRPKVEEKVTRALGSIQPTGTKPAPKQKAVEAMRAKFKQSGSLEDAAALIDSLVG